jgi:kynureninase
MQPTEPAQTTEVARLTRAAAEALDRCDPLASCRECFALPHGMIYMDGNSLGALPVATAGRVAQVVEAWGQDLVGSWNRHDWIGWPRRTGDRIARLIGARPGEVIVADSTSVNIFKLLAAGIRLNQGRRVILSDADNFPTDLYVTQGLERLLAGAVEIRAVQAEDLPSALGGDVSVLMLTHVNYRTGAMHDMAALTTRAHDAGALALWDLSHSAGAMPVALHDANVDLAVGGGYKFLNGGPGAPAYAFAAARWHSRLEPALSGWMGHARPFEFAGAYEPASGIERLLVGTPPVLSLAALDAGLDVFDGVDLRLVRDKSVALGALFRRLVDQECEQLGLRLVSPADPERCGSQICYAHPDGYAIVQALIAQGVVGDFRAPDVLRFGLTPLYLRYADVFDAVVALRDILTTRAYDHPRFRIRARVT